jgi:hypothetical protein
MVKIKTFISRFLASEALPLLVLFIYMIPLFKSRRFIILMIIFLLFSFYLSILNFILAILFYYIKISRMLTLTTIIGFTCITFYLYYNKIYFANDLSFAFSKKSFIGQNLDEILIFLCLIINQLMVKLYFIIWRQ